MSKRVRIAGADGNS